MLPSFRHCLTLLALFGAMACASEKDSARALPVELQQLLTAATDNDAAGIAAALDNGAEVDTPDDTGSTALMLAAEQGNNIAMADLLVAGAESNAVTPSQVTATMRAARAGQVNGIVFLAEQGADLDLIDGGGDIDLLESTHSNALIYAA